MKVAYRGGKKFLVACRGQQLTVDQPANKEGTDAGMTPPELFIASIATCMGVYVVNYCKNANINANDMTLSISWEQANDPARVSSITVDIDMPKISTHERDNAIVKVAEHCLVHNSITAPPQITINLVSHNA